VTARGLVHNVARIASAVTGAVAMTYQYAKFGYDGVLARGVVFVLAFGSGAIVFAMLSDRKRFSAGERVRCSSSSGS